MKILILLIISLLVGCHRYIEPCSPAQLDDAWMEFPVTVGPYDESIALAVDVLNHGFGREVLVAVEYNYDVIVTYVPPFLHGVKGKTNSLWNKNYENLIGGEVHISQDLSHLESTGTLLHELTHSLGIHCHDQNRSSLLYGTISALTRIDLYFTDWIYESMETIYPEYIWERPEDIFKGNLVEWEAYEYH